MSPSSRNPLRVGLCPDRLILAGQRRGLRRTTPRKEIVAVESSRDPTPWQGAVDALPAALARSADHKTEVTVILSNHFVRYALLPWDKTLRSQADWLAFAQHRFASVHGSAVDDWELCVAETAPRGPRIACAADKALLDALEARIAASGATPGPVQPFLTVAFNQIRRTFGGDSRWLVIHEPGCLVVALVWRGVWHSIRTRRVDGHWRTALREVLRRESAVLALEEPCTKIVIQSWRTDDGAPGSSSVPPSALETDALGGGPLVNDRVPALAG